MTIESLQQTLTEAEIECTLEPSQRYSGGRLLVFLSGDRKKRERSLEMTMQEQILGSKQIDIPYHRIQFETALPFTFSDKSSPEVSSFLHFLNRQLELPGFEMDEGNRLILYRYVLLSSEDRLQPDLLKGIIGSISLMLDLFGEAIEKVAVEETTFNEILEKILASVEAIS